MPTKNDIITELYLSENFSSLIKKIKPAHIRDDIRSEVMLLLLSKSDNFVLDLHSRGKLQCYVNKTTMNMVKWRRDVSTTDVIPEVQYEPLNGRVYKEQVEEQALAEINNLPMYEREVVKLYIEFGSYRLIAKETRIPHCSIGGTINSAVKKIRQRVGALPNEHE